MEYTLSQQDDHCVLDMRGTFTFSDNANFRKFISGIHNAKYTRVVLDFRQLEFIDSAALGMLLLLHDEAKKHNAHVRISDAGGQIKKMLQLSNFDEIFEISYAEG